MSRETRHGNKSIVYVYQMPVDKNLMNSWIANHGLNISGEVINEELYALSILLNGRMFDCHVRPEFALGMVNTFKYMREKQLDSFLKFTKDYYEKGIR